MEVVLIDPQIPQNTGSIARTCAATATPLCIVGKPKFEISERTVRRAGLDYWPFVELYQFETWEQYLAARSPSDLWLMTKFAKPLYYNANFKSDSALVFGSETTGIPDLIKERYPSQQLRIPIVCSGVRSLNLSNAVSIVLYEARRQIQIDS